MKNYLFKSKLPIMKNILNKDIKICSSNPMTGYFRDGYCRTGKEDLGTHTVCAKMSKRFLEYTKNKGNDLYSVVKPNDNWCLCEFRWNQAYLDGYAPEVIIESTNMRTDENIVKNIFKHSGGSKKKFLYDKKNPEQTQDIYSDANKNDTINIKYKTIDDVKNTIIKLEKLYKKRLYTHRRISQVAMIMKIRLEIIKKRFPNAKNIDKRFNLSLKYFNFLKKRTKKKKDDRYTFLFFFPTNI